MAHEEKKSLLDPVQADSGQDYQASTSSSIPRISEVRDDGKKHGGWPGNFFLYLALSACVILIPGIFYLIASLPGAYIFIPSNPISLAYTAPTTSEIQIAESIPEGINETLTSPLHTHEAWIDMINSAKQTIDIACYYMTLRDGDPEGTAVYQALAAALARGITVRIVQNKPDPTQPPIDTEALAALGAQLRSADFGNLTTGILHTKFMIFDHVSFYVGSANMDWRSLTQVKELGVVVKNNALLAMDLERIFQLYWAVGAQAAHLNPAEWDPIFETHLNQTNPASITFTGIDGNLHTGNAYLSSAPEACRTPQRTGDIDALVALLDGAPSGSVVRIEVMDYSPTFLYLKPKQYWDRIDTAIRRAAFERQVEVRFLVAHWNHTKSDMWAYMAALDDVASVHVKWFIVPDLTYRTIPFTRVNHAKFMVAANRAYVSTSNWSGDYFVTTAGVSFNTDESFLIQQLIDRHNRDWTSPYAINFRDLPHK